MTSVLLISASRDPEGDAAERWLSQRGIVCTRVDSWSESLALGAHEAQVIWGHSLSVVPPLDERERLVLQERLESDCGLLLTLGSTAVHASLGTESHAPSITQGIWRHDDDPLWAPAFRDWPQYPHVRGVQGWATGTHPLFAGLQRGTFCWDPVEGEAYLVASYEWPEWPQSRVIGVERAYVQLNTKRAMAWEDRIGGGRIVCLGGFVSLTAPSTLLAAQRDHLLENALRYVATRARVRLSTAPRWPSPQSRAPATRTSLPAIAITRLELRGAKLPKLTAGSEGDAPFTLAGEQALVTGTHHSGVLDIWLHPLGVVAGGIAISVDDLGARLDRCEVTPAAITRRLTAGRVTLRETIVPARALPATLLEYELVRGGRTGAQIVLELSLPLRLQWPFPAETLFPLRTTTRFEPSGQGAIAVQGCDGAHAAMIVIDGASDMAVDDTEMLVAEGAALGGVPRVRIVSTPNRPLRLCITAGTSGLPALRTAATALLEGDGATRLSSERTEFFAALTTKLRHRSPDDELDAAVEWAKSRLAMFVGRAPGVGRGLLAGYASSRTGWTISRPGYAWFFGRDACWCGDALLAAGMFDAAKAALEFLAATRDVSGKIAHEVTTSGVAHYDAADATPLFLRFAVAYADWTGDDVTVNAIWPAVREAFAFVLGTDRDADGLPENTGVGHGWIESGPLGGGAVTSYVAAIWIDAVEGLARIATRIGDDEMAAQAQEAFHRAQSALDVRLRDHRTGRLALHLDDAGTREMTLTALAAVPIALGVDRHESADDVVQDLCAVRFTTPWGLRLLPADDARYDPTGYHVGAVWPLYTGWLSLAAFRRGDAVAGLRLLQMNAALHHARALGAFDEVLNGDTGDGAGVCPDQAWSAAMVISPVVYGLWGLQPDASAGVLRVNPRMPDEWQEATLRNVCVGESCVDVHAVRDRNGTGWTVSLRRQSGPALRLVRDEDATGTPRDFTPIDR